MTNGPRSYDQSNQQFSPQQPYQPAQSPYQQVYSQQNAYQQAYQPPYQQPADGAYQQPQQFYQPQGYQQAPQGWPPVQPSGGKSKGRARRIVLIVLCAVLVLALAALGYIGFSYWNGQKTYEAIATDNVQLEQADPYDLASFKVDWDALRAVNGDIIAWIYVPGTNINYPVVWRQNDDQYYLYHNFNGYSSPQFAAEFGCISLSGANQPDLSDQINIISGHNMLDGSMFQPFSTFSDPEVFNSHRTIFLLTPKGNFRLNTFAIDYVLGSSTVPISFATRAEFKEYLQKCIDDSLVQPDPPPPLVRKINKAFAFYTCDNSNDTYRFFIYAYIDDYLPLDGGDKDEAMGNQVEQPQPAQGEGAEGEPVQPLEGGAAVGEAAAERIV